MSQGQRLRNLRKKLGLTQRELSERIKQELKVDIAVTVIFDLEAGKRTQSKYLQTLATFYRVGLDYIVNGVYSTITNITDHSNQELSKLANYPKGGIYIPVIEWDKVCTWKKSGGNMQLVQVTDYVNLPKTASKNSVACVVNTDAMVAPYPSRESIWSGDIIVIDTDKEPTHGCIVTAEVGGNDKSILRKYVIEGGEAWLNAADPQYTAVKVTDEVYICGVVVQVIRESK